MTFLFQCHVPRLLHRDPRVPDPSPGDGCTGAIADEQSDAKRSGQPGAHFSLLSSLSRFRPYGEIGLAVRAANWHDPTIGEVNILGPAATIGVGLAFFVVPSVALDLGGGIAFGNLADVTVNGAQMTDEPGASALRANDLLSSGHRVVGTAGLAA